MSKRVFRFFWLFMTSQEQWLNKMADNGYRLSGTTTAHYEFEATEETTLHKELLIIEKEKDGAEFKLCPTFEQRYNAYSKLRL